MYVRLRPAEIEALVRLARTERRHPADQAAMLIVRGLHDAPQPPQAQRELVTPAAEARQ
jgi:hypothetical protein